MTTEVRPERPTQAEVPTPPRRRPGMAGPARAASPLDDPPVRREPATPKAAATPRPPIEATIGERAATPFAQKLAWAVAIVGLLGTLGFGLAWRSASGHHASSAAATQVAETQAVRQAAEQFSLALTNFDGSTIDHDFDRIVARSTGDFQKQANQFFSSSTRQALKVAQASSRGEIRDAFVQSVSGSQASVFVVVDQTIANNKSPQPQADTLRMDLTVQHTATGWLVGGVDVLTAPGAGTALPGSTTSGASPTGSGGN